MSVELLAAFMRGQDAATEEEWVDPDAAIIAELDAEYGSCADCE